MRKSWLIVGAVALVLVGGIIVWLVLGARPQNSSTNTINTNDSTATVEEEVVASQTTVTIKNSAFTPQNLKVKKGTTVKWVNEDAVRHNVVALNESAQGGLPAENALLGKGESYSFTFETVGTFEYKCSPHPFMTGKIEVVQ